MQPSAQESLLKDFLEVAIEVWKAGPQANHGLVVRRKGRMYLRRRIGAQKASSMHEER